MWPDGTVAGPAGPGPSNGSVVPLNDPIMAAARDPIPVNMFVSKSPGTHVGPKIITQHIQNNEVVQDLPLPRYLCMVLQNTTRAERVSCAVAILLVIVCTVLIVYFTVFAKNTEEIVDVAPHEWNITREMWLARSCNVSDLMSPKYEPIRLVIVQHTVSQECTRFKKCAAELRNLQSYFLDNSQYDIPYNFLIGNDGRVYEGRGWRVVGAHTKYFNKCSLGIGFIGDYRAEMEVHSKVTEAQLNRTQMLLKAGVEWGYLHPDYVVVGAKDLQVTESPGSNLYNALKTLEHYNNIRYHNMSCDQIITVPLGTDS